MDKVIDIEDRIPTLREKRRRRTNFKFILLISLFFFALFLLLYFQSSYSDINKINISGSELVKENVYLEKSQLHIGDSMWSFQVSDVEKRLKKDEWVKDVSVKRKWLTTVEIHVEEWQKVAYISENNAFYPMLENGVIFKQSSSIVPIDAPVFLQFDDEKVRKKLLKELAKLDAKNLALISQINATPTSTDPYSITLFMNDGYEVRAEITSLSDKLKFYPSIIAQIESSSEFEKGIIDIEVGSYYRSYTDEYQKINVNFEAGTESEEQEVNTDENPSSE